MPSPAATTRGAGRLVGQDQLAETGRGAQMLDHAPRREQIDRAALDDAEVVPARTGLEDRLAAKVVRRSSTWLTASSVSSGR